MNVRMMFWTQWFCILLLCMMGRISCGDVVHSVTMGKTSWGEWGDEVICPDGAKVTGFRLKVEERQGLWDDDTALNGIQLECENDHDTDEIDGPFGGWNVWVTCLDGHYVTGFNFRSEGDQGWPDDVAGVNVKMRCDNGEELDGDGIDDWGTWDRNGYEQCPANSYFCGVQAKIEHDTNVDHTALNKMKFLCCETGLGNWNPWSTWSRCSHTCGEGTRKRKRSCTDGQLCMTSQGEEKPVDFQSESCEMSDCPGPNNCDQKVCLAVYSPVCASDGKTYSNNCTLGIASCIDTSIKFMHNGDCAGPNNCDHRVCLAVYSPVCASDGKTYSNNCTLGTAQCKDATIKFMHNGDCAESCVKICAEKHLPVCGSNGVTYGNICELKNAVCDDSTIKPAYKGRCGDISHCDLMLCRAIHRPVCASDGKTYSNNCTLGIASCKDKTIKFMHNGDCAGPLCKKMCGEIHQPVCGTNKVTYSNKCELGNAICGDSTIKLAYKGRCGGLGYTKCRKESNVDGRLVGRYIPQCTLEGLYEILQCHGSTGYCWCANQYTGEEIEGTNKGPGDGSISVAQCIAAVHRGLVGVWKYTSGNGGSETHRISKDGNVIREDAYGNQLGLAKLTPSNDKPDFPTSEGWFMMVGLHGKLSSQYIRWNRDDTVETHHFCLQKCEQVVDFCERQCDATYDNSKDFYCCAAKGFKKLTKGAVRSGKGSITFSLHLEVLEGDIKHYDVIVTELGEEPRFPRSNPHSYTNEDIKNNVDGLYVAGRVRDKKLFGKIFVVGENNGRSRRSLAEPDNRPLKKDVYYGVFVRGYITEDDYTTSPWYPPTKASSKKSDTWKTAIAVVVVVVIVVIAAVLIIIHRWKKRKNSLKDASNQTSQRDNPAYVPDNGGQELAQIPNFTASAPPPYEPTKNVNFDNFAVGADVELNEKPGIPDDANYERMNRVVPNIYERAVDPNRIYLDPDNIKSQENTVNQPNNIRTSQTEDESWKVRPRPRPSRTDRNNENNIERNGIQQSSPTNPFTPGLYEPNYQDPSLQHPGDPFARAGDPNEAFYHEIGGPAVKYNVPTGVTFTSPNTPPPDYSELNNTAPQQPINVAMPGYNRLDNSTTQHDTMIQPIYSELHNSIDPPRPRNEPAPGYNKLDKSTGKQSSFQPYEQISVTPGGAVGLPGATDSAFTDSGVVDLNAAHIDNSFGLYDNPHYSVPRVVETRDVTNDVINNADSYA